MKVRPKEYSMFQFCGWKCTVELKPQQKWYYTKTKDGYKVYRKGISLNLTETEFEEYFRKVEE